MQRPFSPTTRGPKAQLRTHGTMGPPRLRVMSILDDSSETSAEAASVDFLSGNGKFVRSPQRRRSRFDFLSKFRSSTTPTSSFITDIIAGDHHQHSKPGHESCSSMTSHNTSLMEDNSDCKSVLSMPILASLSPRRRISSPTKSGPKTPRRGVFRQISETLRITPRKTPSTSTKSSRHPPRRHMSCQADIAWNPSTRGEQTESGAVNKAPEAAKPNELPSVSTQREDRLNQILGSRRKLIREASGLYVQQKRKEYKTLEEAVSEFEDYSKNGWKSLASRQPTPARSRPQHKRASLGSNERRREMVDKAIHRVDEDQDHSDSAAWAMHQSIRRFTPQNEVNRFMSSPRTHIQSLQDAIKLYDDAARSVASGDDGSIDLDAESLNKETSEMKSSRQVSNIEKEEEESGYDSDGNDAMTCPPGLASGNYGTASSLHPRPLTRRTSTEWKACVASISSKRSKNIPNSPITLANSVRLSRKSLSPPSKALVGMQSPQGRPSPRRAEMRDKVALMRAPPLLSPKNRKVESFRQLSSTSMVAPNIDNN